MNDVKKLAINGEQAEMAVLSCVGAIAEMLAKRIDDGTADDDAYESLIAMVLAHELIKKAIMRDGADAYKYTADGGFEVEKK